MLDKKADMKHAGQKKDHIHEHRSVTQKYSLRKSLTLADALLSKELQSCHIHLTFQ